MNVYSLAEFNALEIATVSGGGGGWFGAAKKVAALPLLPS